MWWNGNRKSQKMSPLYKMAENLQELSSPILGALILIGVNTHMCAVAWK